MITRTRTRSAGVEFPHVESYSNRRTKVSWSSPSVNNSRYYAGAKFDTIPALSDLPMPPSHWTDSSSRSQSTPSSPVTITTPSTTPISLDIKSLFGPRATCDTRGGKAGVFKSGSLPHPGILNMVHQREKSLLQTQPEPLTFKTPQNVKARPTLKIPTKPQVKTASKVSPAPVIPKWSVLANDDTPVAGPKVKDGKTKATGISGLDLMEMLIRASPTYPQDLNSTPTSAAKKASSVKLSPCHLQLGSKDSQYKDISAHLKSILNVSA